jgi:hypothetical protein
VKVQETVLPSAYTVCYKKKMQRTSHITYFNHTIVSCIRYGEGSRIQKPFTGISHEMN